MIEQINLLRELQEIDLELDERLQAKEQIFKQTQDHKDMLQKLEQDLDGQRAELDETAQLKAKREEELRETEERFNTSKERLMNISSTKEYNAVEKEMDQLKRKADETREQLDHLKEAIALNTRHIDEKETKIKTLHQQIHAVEEEAEGQIVTLEREIGRWTRRQGKSRKEIKQGLLRRYDFIRSRRGGKAVAAAKDGHCEGCFMALPPQLFIQVQRGKTLESCPSCQRILYFNSPEVAAET